MLLKRSIQVIMCGTFLALLMNCRSSINNFQDPEFKPYLAEFSRLSEKVDKSIAPKVGNISVVFGKLDDKYFAEARFSENTVVVNKKLWVKLTPSGREELIFHELGHIILDLEHEDGTIMQAQGMLGEIWYTTFYSDLLNIHFGCIPMVCINETYNFNKYPKAKEQQLTLKEILENEHAVVRFTATWCPPCKALAPVFDEVAAAHPDVKTYVVDVDQNKDLASEMNIRGIPAMVCIRKQKVDQVLVGNQPKPEIEKLFKE